MQLLHAETMTKSVRHTLAVTLDTCLYAKEGVRLISTYPKTQSVDSAYRYIIQIINALFKVGFHSTRAKKKNISTYLPFFSP